MSYPKVAEMFKQVVVLLVGLLLTAVSVQAARISVEDVPKAVMDGLKADHPDARNIEVDKEMHFGMILYEVKFKTHGDQHEALYDRQGRPFAHENALKPAQLPVAVTDKLGQLFSSYKIKDVEEVDHPDGRIEYEIDVIGDGVAWEIVMDANANVLVKERD